MLERYPTRTDGESPAPSITVERSSPPAANPSALSPTPAAGGTPLITLDRGFDLDRFSSLLGETSIRVTVPRDDLLEVVRRILEFTGFGIYVYAVSIRPGPSDLLKEFVVELRRVDYSADRAEWIPFQEKPPGPS